MIAKEKTGKPAAGRRQQAGDAAERQMAHYLHRRFAENANIFVFNDLRLERAGEVAQIDHLVLHKFGMIIIESKSVSGEIHINQQAEFVRVHGRKRTGMMSPIQQARRQGELLLDLLMDHTVELRSKRILGLVQGGFKCCPIEVMAAISDQGIIKGNRKSAPELHEADQIVDAVQANIDRHRKSARLTSIPDGSWGLYSFQPEELTRIRAFLLANHAPAPSAAPERPTVAVAVVKPAPRSQPTPRSQPEKPVAAPGYLCTHTTDRSGA